MSSTTKTAARQSASGDEFRRPMHKFVSVVEQLNRGDRHAAGQAFIELYNRHYTLLRASSPRGPAAAMPTISPGSWQRVWQHLPTRFRGGNFGAWVHEIARNYLIDCSRRRKRGRN